LSTLWSTARLRLRMRILRYFLWRVGAAVPTLLAIVTIAFFMVRAAPGGPFDQERALPRDVVARLEAAYGLDQPVVVQYARYLRALAHGDFGPSLKYRDFSVSELIAQGLPVSFALGGLALVFALACGVGLGVWAALREDSLPDRASIVVAVLGVAVPAFVLLPLLDLLFGIHWRWLPVAGWEPGSLRHLVLPALALGLPPLGIVARLTRTTMQEVLASPYVRTARAKGLPLGLVLRRHALRPALLPVAGYLAPAAAAVMSGSLVVESIAGLPGIGRHLVQGALNRDYTLVLGMVIVYSALLIGMGLLVDLCHAWLDPRVRRAA